MEYAWQDTHKHMGVAEYRLAGSLPEDLKGSLPSIEELEAEIGGGTSIDESLVQVNGGPKGAQNVGSSWFDEFQQKHVARK